VAEESHGYCGGRQREYKPKKRPAAAGLFFDVGDGRTTTTIFIMSVSLSRWQMIGRRRMVVANRLVRLSSPMESLPHRGDGSVLGEEERHLRYFWGREEK